MSLIIPCLPKHNWVKCNYPKLVYINSDNKWLPFSPLSIQTRCNSNESNYLKTKYIRWILYWRYSKQMLSLNVFSAVTNMCDILIRWITLDKYCQHIYSFYLYYWCPMSYQHINVLWCNVNIISVSNLFFQIVSFMFEWFINVALRTLWQVTFK